MCKQGDTASVAVTRHGVPIVVGIDACLGTLITALNSHGFETVASCCGHGECVGSIVLRDGRELVIAWDLGTAHAIRAFLEGAKADAPSE